MVIPLIWFFWILLVHLYYCLCNSPFAIKTNNKSPPKQSPHKKSWFRCFFHTNHSTKKKQEIHECKLQIQTLADHEKSRGYLFSLNSVQGAMGSKCSSRGELFNESKLTIHGFLKTPQVGSDFLRKKWREQRTAIVGWLVAEGKNPKKIVLNKTLLGWILVCIYLWSMNLYFALETCAH